VRDNPALEIRECNGCGLVYLGSNEHIREGHYEASRMHGETPPSIEVWLKDAVTDDQRRFRMLHPLLVNRNLLDFGCGAGGFLSLAKSVASEVVGIELESRVSEYWGTRLALHSGLDQVDKKLM
jgi:2-polyprenyl-3-methyl-5-hydroxy-6-metoxy-1,4-benzoquinol methylase